MIAITTRYLGPTDTKGARIVAETPNGHRLVRSFDYAHFATSAHAAVACELARSLNWNPDTLIEGETKNGHVFVFANSQKWDVATGEAAN